MEINRDNYEQFFLDHAEGSLSPEMEGKLADFLRANPDLRPELDDYDTSPLTPEEVKNDRLKTRLKKNIHPTDHINEGNAEEWLIREAEGLHSAAEANELEEFIKSNPAYEYDRKMFLATKLQPDLSVIFTRKGRLKKKPAVLWIPRLAWAVPVAAAVILMFLGIRLFYQAQVVEEKPEVAQTDTQQPGIKQTEIKVLELDSQVTIGTPSQGMASRGTPSPGMESHSPFRMTAAVLAELPVATRPDEFAITLTLRNMLTAIVLQPQEKPLVARVFRNFFSRTGQAVKENLNVGNDRRKQFDFWTIAEVGIKGYNSISDRDLELMLRRNREGKIKAYALIDEDRLVLSRSLDKN